MVGLLEQLILLDLDLALRNQLMQQLRLLGHVVPVVLSVFLGTHAPSHCSIHEGHHKQTIVPVSNKSVLLSKQIYERR